MDSSAGVHFDFSCLVGFVAAPSSIDDMAKADGLFTSGNRAASATHKLNSETDSETDSAENGLQKFYNLGLSKNLSGAQSLSTEFISELSLTICL